MLKVVFEADYAAHFAMFRRSFAVVGALWKSVDDLPAGEGMKTFPPQENVKFTRIR